MNIALFEKDEIAKPLSVKDERGEHLVKVLHKKIGDTFTCGIEDGPSGTATITNIEDGFITFDFKPETDGKPLYPLVMIIGFPRPIQLKRLLRDVAALGVCEVHLTGTELGEKSYMQSNLLERGSARKMLWDGTVQAGSTHLPKLVMHQTLKECLDELAQTFPDSEKYALDNIRPKGSLKSVVAAPVILSEAEGSHHGMTIAAIGSERGWTDKERDLLENSGYVLCGMGCRIMRTETAATVAASIILNEKGYLE